MISHVLLGFVLVDYILHILPLVHAESVLFVDFVVSVVVWGFLLVFLSYRAKLVISNIKDG